MQQSLAVYGNAVTVTLTDATEKRRIVLVCVIVDPRDLRNCGQIWDEERISLRHMVEGKNFPVPSVYITLAEGILS